MKYEYDTDDQRQFVVEIRQGGDGTGTYTSEMRWEKALGAKKWEKDENGQEMSYTYDEYGRLVEVRSPYDAGEVPAVKYEYFTPANDNWYAVTENKIRFKEDDESVMTTVLMLDSLGRALYTAKNGEVWNNGKPESGWNVSGAVKYDEKGRVTEEGQVRFYKVTRKEDPVGDLLAGWEPRMLLPTKKEYDGLDRVVKVTLPDGESEGTEYGIRDGKGYVRVIDAEGNRSEKESDGRGNVTSTSRYDQSWENELTRGGYRYNALGEMLEAVDYEGNALTVKYDLLGRKVSMESDDMGKKEWGYDQAGNLSWERDSVLAKAGKRIDYRYDGMNRLTEVVYPKRADTVAETKTTYTYGEPYAPHNSAGRVTKVEDESGTSEYQYGRLGETVWEKRTIKTRDPVRTEKEKEAEMSYKSNYLGQMEWIKYPDGEVVSYAYDGGGQIRKVSGERHGQIFDYVKEIGYDEWSQRVYMEAGNGVTTEYSYNPERRWLKEIASKRSGVVYQNINYEFDKVGNVLGYENKGGRYETKQSYGYDELYQLTSATGTSTQYRYQGGSTEDYRADYEQTFEYDMIGNLTRKESQGSKTRNVRNGMDMNYTFDYEYYGKGHKAERIGDRYYRYDGNGNVTVERAGGHGEAGSGEGYWHEDGIYGTGYGFALVKPGSASTDDAYERRYTWDWQNRLIATKDNQYTVEYGYGYDGQRRVKYTAEDGNETLYFNQMWQMSAGSSGRDWLRSKHIFVGETRIATKSNWEYWDSGIADTTDFEEIHQYWYHSDHLGSAQLVTGHNGDLHERLEYAPYGEIWVEHKYDTDDHSLPYRFTGKELDNETGFYYFGSRYLDPRTSRWVSADPAVSDYIPQMPADDDARKRNGNLPGMGGVYNLVNLHVYHYAGNNPVKYVDPNGRTGSFPDGSVEQNAQWEKAHGPDVTFEVQRDVTSYTTIGGRNINLRNGDRLTFTNNRTGEMVSFPVSSVPNMAEGVRGDAVAPGDVYLTLGPSSTMDSKYAPDVLTISGGKTVSGENINSRGLVPSSEDAYRVHDSPNSASMGCFTGLKDTSGGPVRNAIDVLKGWGVKYGGAMKGRLRDVVVPVVDVGPIVFNIPRGR